MNLDKSKYDTRIKPGDMIRTANHYHLYFASVSKSLYLSLPDVIFGVVVAFTTLRPLRGSTTKVTREQEKEEVARHTFSELRVVIL